MQPTLIPRVKVCCISSVEEAWIAIRHGASALGLASKTRSDLDVVADLGIAEIAGAVPPPIATFLLTSSQDAGEIVTRQRRGRTNTVQLCDRLETGSYRDLRRGMPGVSLVQVIHVIDETSLKEAVRIAPFVDALLLDTHDQMLQAKESAGTGRTRDWRISRSIREQVNIPVFLSGGLKPENVAEAIRYVGPFGVDVCSGVRADGRLSELKLTALLREIGRSNH